VSLAGHHQSMASSNPSPFRSSTMSKRASRSRTRMGASKKAALSWQGAGAAARPRVSMATEGPNQRWRLMPTLLGS